MSWSKPFAPAISVDFDGTLTERVDWPDVGAPRLTLIAACLRAQSAGIVVILDTCRSGKLLDDALRMLNECGLFPDFVNENDPARVRVFGDDCRKISSDQHHDDRVPGWTPPIGICAIDQFIEEIMS